MVFSMDGEIFEKEILSHKLQEIYNVELAPNESYFYIIETLKILPALKISYLENKCKKAIISNRIKNIELIDKDLTEINSPKSKLK